MLTALRMFLSLRRLQRRELVDVGTRNERLLPRARDDDDANRSVVLQLQDGASKFVGGRGVQGIEDGRAIDGDDRDGTVALEKEVVKSHVVGSGQGAVGRKCFTASCHLPPAVYESRLYPTPSRRTARSRSQRCPNTSPQHPPCAPERTADEIHR